MTEEQELGDWLAENLMGWRHCGTCWHGEDGGPVESDWLTTTGDGMLAVLEKLEELTGWNWFGLLGSVLRETRRTSELPLAVARAAKAALEAK